MILKGQYFMGAGKHHTKPMLATDENEHGELSPLSNGWGGNPFVMPITVRRMFELLECPVPEGAKVCQFVNQTYGIVYWTTVLPCGGVLGPGETKWDKYSYAPSKDTLDLSDLPVTEEVIESLPEPLQEKWKELL